LVGFASANALALACDGHGVGFICFDLFWKFANHRFALAIFSASNIKLSEV